jgi:hypothetical protein
VERRFARSECVLLGHLRLLWNEELLEHVQIHDTGNGRLHEEVGAVHCYVHQTCSALLHYDTSKRCVRVCPRYKFVYSFKVAKLFLKHPMYSESGNYSIIYVLK